MGAGLAHGQQTAGAVVAHAGEHCAHGIAAGALGHRTEQHIHRRAVVVDQGPSRTSTRYCAPLRRRHHVAGAGRNEHAARQHAVAVAGFEHISPGLQPRGPAKAVVNCAGMCCTTTMPGGAALRAAIAAAGSPGSARRRSERRGDQAVGGLRHGRCGLGSGACRARTGGVAGGMGSARRLARPAAVTAATRPLPASSGSCAGRSWAW